MKKHIVCIRGIVTPCEWLDDETVTSVIISADDEQEYLVDNTEKGRELLKMARQSIIASGLVRVTPDGKKTIQLEAYQTVPAAK